LCSPNSALPTATSIWAFDLKVMAFKTNSPTLVSVYDVDQKVIKPNVVLTAIIFEPTVHLKTSWKCSLNLVTINKRID